MIASPILLLPPRSYPEQAAVEIVWRQRGLLIVRLDRFAAPPGLEAARVKVYGDYEFCVVIAQALGLELVSPPDDLLVGLDWHWLKREMHGLSLGEVIDGSYPYFVKPLAPKLFPAKVYTSRRALTKATANLSSETPVLASEPVSLACEVRCLVLNHRIIASSVFEGVGDVSEAARFAQDFVDNHRLPVTLVLDVGMIQGRGWAVVEANAVWGSGLNGCDPGAMADCVAAATRVSA